MQKAINRFWDWLFHPSIRYYKSPNPKAVIYRYPSPGNFVEQTPNHIAHQDYKTSYYNSSYNVRFANPVPVQRDEVILQFNVISPAITPIIKLKKVGLLKDGEQNNPDALAKAKKQYLEIYKLPVEENVLKNQFDYNVVKSKNRQQIAAYIHNFYEMAKENREAAQLLNSTSNRKVIDDPETIPLQSVDMFTSPALQHTKIQLQYLLDAIHKQNATQEFIKTNVGDANFWKAIDNSFPLQQVQKVQKHVGDPNPTSFEYKSGKIERQFDKNGNVSHINPKI